MHMYSWRLFNPHFICEVNDFRKITKFLGGTTRSLPLHSSYSHTVHITRNEEYNNFTEIKASDIKL